MKKAMTTQAQGTVDTTAQVQQGGIKKRHIFGAFLGGVATGIAGTIAAKKLHERRVQRLVESSEEFFSSDDEFLDDFDDFEEEVIPEEPETSPVQEEDVTPKTDEDEVVDATPIRTITIPETASTEPVKETPVEETNEETSETEESVENAPVEEEKPSEPEKPVVKNCFDEFHDDGKPKGYKSSKRRKNKTRNQKNQEPQEVKTAEEQVTVDVNNLSRMMESNGIKESHTSTEEEVSGDEPDTSSMNQEDQILNDAVLWSDIFDFQAKAECPIALPSFQVIDVPVETIVDLDKRFESGDEEYAKELIRIIEDITGSKPRKIKRTIAFYKFSELSNVWIAKYFAASVKNMDDLRSGAPMNVQDKNSDDLDTILNELQMYVYSIPRSPLFAFMRYAELLEEQWTRSKDAYAEEGPIDTYIKDGVLLERFYNLYDAHSILRKYRGLGKDWAATLIKEVIEKYDSEDSINGFSMEYNQLLDYTFMDIISVLVFNSSGSLVYGDDLYDEVDRIYNADPSDLTVNMIYRVILKVVTYNRYLRYMLSNHAHDAFGLPFGAVYIRKLNRMIKQIQETTSEIAKVDEAFTKAIELPETSSPKEVEQEVATEPVQEEIPEPIPDTSAKEAVETVVEESQEELDAKLWTQLINFQTYQIGRKKFLMMDAEEIHQLGIRFNETTLDALESRGIYNSEKVIKFYNFRDIVNVRIMKYYFLTLRYLFAEKNRVNISQVEKISEQRTEVLETLKWTMKRVKRSTLYMFYIQAETLEHERTHYGCTLKSVKPVEEYVKDGLPTDLFYDFTNAIQIYRGCRGIVTTEAMKRYNEVLNILGVKDEDFGYHSEYISGGVDYAFKDALDIIFGYDNGLVNSFKEIITEDLESNDKIELNGYVRLALAYNNHVHKLAKATSYGKLLEQTLLINVETKSDVSSDSDDDQIAKTDKEFDDALTSSTPESAPLEWTPVVTQEIKEELVSDPIGETPANESETDDEIQEQSEEESVEPVSNTEDTIDVPLPDGVEISENAAKLKDLTVEIANTLMHFSVDDADPLTAAKELSKIYDKVTACEELAVDLTNPADTIIVGGFRQVADILYRATNDLVNSMDESLGRISNYIGEKDYDKARDEYDTNIKPYITLSYVPAEKRTSYAKLGEAIMDLIISRVEETKKERQQAYKERKSRKRNRNRK